MMLSDDQLDEVFVSRFTHTAFRLERQPAYEVPSDHLDEDPTKVSDYDRWLSGATEPLWERKRPYLEVLKQERRDLKCRYRVRILGGHNPVEPKISPTGLHSYEEYECAFGYVPNYQAGEDIFILDRGTRPVPSQVVEHDFWLLDDEVVIRMWYGSQGEYESAELIEDSGQVGLYRAARNAAMVTAEPFTGWWARHPELHRAGRHVAA
jgi:hypothetical protein